MLECLTESRRRSLLLGVLNMKQRNALDTAASALSNARDALKPAIMDLASTPDDHSLAQMMKLWLSMQTMEHRLHRGMRDIPQEY